MSDSEAVYLGIKGSVIALDKSSGKRLWATRLKGNDFVTLLVEGSRVFAGARGEVFCLDAATGKQLWHDSLKGFGWGLLSIAAQNESARFSPAMAEWIRRQQAADGGDGGGE